MNLHCLEVSEGSSCPHRSQSHQGFLVQVSVDYSKDGGIAMQGGSAGGEACEEQSSHGLQLGPTQDF